MRLVLISDTHTYHKSVKIPEGDVLIHAGDFSHRGRREEVEHFFSWFSTQPHEYKVCIAGNHELDLERKPLQASEWMVPFLSEKVIYLKDSACTINGLKFWGSPFTPEFCGWAWQLYTPGEAYAKWLQIPDDTDILITHGPPAGIGDLIPSDNRRVGCSELIKALARVKPKLHVFGHIHDSYGVYGLGSTTIVNAAICDDYYNPIHAPIMFDTETLIAS